MGARTHERQGERWGINDNVHYRMTRIARCLCRLFKKARCNKLSTALTNNNGNRCNGVHTSASQARDELLLCDTFPRGPLASQGLYQQVGDATEATCL